MIITINNVDYSMYVTYPIDNHITCTEELDSASFELMHTSVATPFEPFSIAKIGAEAWCVANDVVTEVIGCGKYNHKVTLIELTKLLERYLMEGKSFKQSQSLNFTNVYAKIQHMSRQYQSNSYKIKMTTDDGIPVERSQSQFASVITTTTAPSFLFSDGSYTWLENGISGKSGLMYVHIYNGNDQLTEDELSTYLDEIGTNEHVIAHADLEHDDENGGWIVPSLTTNKEGYHYLVLVLTPDLNVTTNLCMYQTMYVASSRLTPPYYTNNEILYTLAVICGQDRVGRTQHHPYSVSTNISNSAWGQAKANDIYFNDGATLLEDLRLLFSTNGAIPKLTMQSNNLVLDWILQGGNEEDTTFATGKKLAHEESFNAAEYATTIESSVANMVNNDASMCFPLESKGITFRASDVLIKEGTGRIELPFPAYTITSVVCTLNNVQYDFTKYMFESQEYENLSNYSGAYPYTKCFALKYTKGGNVIEGFWYRIDDSSFASWGLLSKYAIANIFGLHGVSINQTDYAKLQWTVEYIPMVDAKVRQYKTESNGMTKSVQAYNQSAKIINAKEYAKGLKGQVAKMGTSDTNYQMLYSGSTIPTPGKIAYDNEYITEVYSRMYPTYNISQVVLTTNFNGIGAYVEIPQEVRQYDIPSGTVRNTIYESFVDVSDASETIPIEGFFGSRFQKMICDSLKKDASTYGKVDRSLVYTYDATQQEIARVILPSYSIPFGNSVVFNARCIDNVIAGNASELISTTGGVEKRLIKAINYGDLLYSTFKYLSFAFTDVGTITTDFPNSYPKNNYPTMSNQIVYGTYDKIDYMKDTADTLNITAQVHFVSSKGWFISDNLAKIMRCVGGLATGNLVVRTYNAKVNRLTLDEPTTHSDQLTTTTGMILGEATFVTINEIPTNTYQSWILGFANGSNFMPLVAGNGIVPLNTCFNLKNNI